VAADTLVEAADTVNANAQMARELARGLHPIEIRIGTAFCLEGTLLAHTGF
jgi:hypothetical protein